MLARTTLALCACALLLVASARADDNGRARTPPLGWRSWNFFQCNINQTIMEAAFEALVDRSRTVDGKPTSLADLGYVDAGVDDCWQQCGSYGPNRYSYHNASGWPQVNTTAFPSISGMVDRAHALGLRAGFYANNCHCRDHCGEQYCFESDVQAVLEWGFDSIKIDGCGAEENAPLWRHVLNVSSTKPIMIENCHNGPLKPTGTRPDQCPYHMYRSSEDIAPCFGSIISNLQSVTPLAEKGLSYPGCWAYPDMLEVMQTNSLGRMPLLTPTESRSHFGAWAIVSSPLILGFDITNASLMDAAWPFIANPEVLAVNQQWAGFSGAVFYTSSATTFFKPCGWWEANCTHPSAQYLYKPQPGNGTAVLLMNNADTATTLSLTFSTVPSLQPAASYHVRDLWARKDLGEFTDTFEATQLPSRDSAFLLLNPV